MTHDSCMICGNKFKSIDSYFIRVKIAMKYAYTMRYARSINDIRDVPQRATKYAYVCYECAKKFIEDTPLKETLKLDIYEMKRFNAFENEGGCADDLRSRVIQKD